MPRFTSFEKLSKLRAFFDALDSGKNEDGYTAASSHYARRASGIAATSTNYYLKRLEDIGVIKVFRFTPDRKVVNQRSESREPSRTHIVKILQPFTKELYMEFIYKKVIGQEYEGGGIEEEE